MADRLMEAPQLSFPNAFDESELEAVYRLFNNPRVTFRKILTPHIAATLDRAERQGKCLAIHDTTDHIFGGAKRRQGLGFTYSNTQGFFGHYTLLVSDDESRTPLGIAEAQTVVRPERKYRSWRTGAPGKTQLYSEDRESRRWVSQLRETHDKLAKRADCVHVMDREADFYELLSEAKALGARFVIRAAHNRVLESAADEREYLKETAAKLSAQARRSIVLRERLSSEYPGKRKHYPPRKARRTTLLVAGKSVTLLRPIGRPDCPDTLGVNVVRVWEKGTPKSEPKVEWLLLTTEPIATPEQLWSIVDAYRARWLIEEYFKALKTGCSLEKRQLESYHSITNALALFVPIAWRLLLLRSVSRTTPAASPQPFFTTMQLAILQHKTKLQKAASIIDALLAIAKLGGHLRRNGPPGWQTLWRGYQKLLILEQGFKLSTICDLS